MLIFLGNPVRPVGPLQWNSAKHFHQFLPCRHVVALIFVCPPFDHPRGSRFLCRRTRFSNSRAARERKIGSRVERNAARKMSIGRESSQRSIIPILSDTSRFWGGTVALTTVACFS